MGFDAKVARSNLIAFIMHNYHDVIHIFTLFLKYH